MSKTNKITMEDKKRILARAFFTDNRDQYEDYHEALTEFMSGQNVTDRFIEFGAEPYLRGKEGYELFTNKDGHVVAFREHDGHVLPITEMDEDEGDAFNEALQKLADENPVADMNDIFEKLGWKQIPSQPTTPEGER